MLKATTTRHAGATGLFPRAYSFFNVHVSMLLFASNVARALSQWVLVVIFAVGSGPDEVGKYTIALSVVSPIYLLAEMSLRNVFVTYKASISYSVYFRLRILSSSLAAVTILGLVLALKLPWVLLVIISVTRFADSLCDMAYASYQKRGKIMFIALTSLSNSALTIALGSGAYIVTKSIPGALLGSLFSSVLIAAYVVIGARRYEKNRPAKKNTIPLPMLTLLKAGVPSGLAYATASYLMYLPVYYLGASEGPRAVGLFAIMVYFPTFAHLLFSSLQQAKLHVLAAKSRSAENSFLRSLVIRQLIKEISLSTILAVGTYIMADVLLVALYGADGRASQASLIYLGLSILPIPVIYLTGSLLLVKNMYNTQLLVGGVALLLTAIFGFIIHENFSVDLAALLLLFGTSVRAILGGLAAAISLRQGKGEV